MIQSATPIELLVGPAMPGSGTMPTSTPCFSASCISVGCPLSMPTSPRVNAAKAFARLSPAGATGPTRPLSTRFDFSQLNVLMFSSESMSYEPTSSV